MKAIAMIALLMACPGSETWNLDDHGATLDYGPIYHWWDGRNAC